MAKYYKTTNPTFKDFVYQPDKQLLTRLASQKVKEDYHRKQLLKDAPDLQFNYLGTEKEEADRYIDDLDKKVNDISKKAYENPEDVGSYISELNNLKREVDKSFRNGEINNFQKSYKSKKRFEKQLSQLSPQAADTYRRKIWDKWSEGKERSSSGNPFDFDEQLYDERSFIKEFTDSSFWKNMRPDQRSNYIEEFRNAQRLIRNGTVDTKYLEKTKIGKAAKDFLREQHLENGYAQNREKYTDQRWLTKDEKGNPVIDFGEGTEARQIVESIGDALTYKQVSDRTRSKRNPFYQSEQEREPDFGAPLNVNTANLISASNVLQEKQRTEVNKVLDAINSVAGDVRTIFNDKIEPKSDGYYTTSEVNEVMDLVEQKKGKESILYKKLQTIREGLRKYQKASKAQLQETYGTKTVDKLFKNLDSQIGLETEVHMPDSSKEDSVMSSPVEENTTRLQDLDEITFQGRKHKVRNVKIDKDSTLPILIQGTDGQQRSLSDNFLMVRVEFEIDSKAEGEKTDSSDPAVTQYSSGEKETKKVVRKVYANLGQFM